MLLTEVVDSESDVPGAWAIPSLGSKRVQEHELLGDVELMRSGESFLVEDERVQGGKESCVDTGSGFDLMALNSTLELEQDSKLLGVLVADLAKKRGHRPQGPIG